MNRGLPIAETWWIILPVLTNLALAVAGFYLAWRLWQWRQALVTLRSQLDHWHGQLGQGVKPALIQPTQGQLAHLKQTYSRVSKQLQRGAQILAWVGLAWRLGRGWQWSTRARAKSTPPRHHRRHEKR
ncbi:MAG: hypothetical protein ACKO4L_13360 [Nodosilinea sp.]